jgi:hypothetical protein
MRHSRPGRIRHPSAVRYAEFPICQIGGRRAWGSLKWTAGLGARRRGDGARDWGLGIRGQGRRTTDNGPETSRKPYCCLLTAAASPRRRWRGLFGLTAHSLPPVASWLGRVRPQSAIDNLQSAMPRRMSRSFPKWGAWPWFLFGIRTIVSPRPRSITHSRRGRSRLSSRTRLRCQETRSPDG